MCYAFIFRRIFSILEFFMKILRGCRVKTAKNNRAARKKGCLNRVKSIYFHAKRGHFSCPLYVFAENQKSFRHFKSLQAFWAAARDSFALATAPFLLFGYFLFYFNFNVSGVGRDFASAARGVFRYINFARVTRCKDYLFAPETTRD